MNKKVIILGGTKGLGLSIAKKAAALGMHPIILGTSVNDVFTLKGLPQGSEIYQADLCAINKLDPKAYGNGDIAYLFWVSGVFLKKRLTEVSDDELDQMTKIHFTGPLTFLRNFLTRQHKPFHLITIASCSSWRLREHETVYTSLKAAQACFARNLADELASDFPGSKSLLINPGGLNTPNFWKNEDIDTTDFLDPDLVSKIIWKEVFNQKSVFKEMQILRNKPVVPGDPPIIEYGPKIPEIPSLL